MKKFKEYIKEEMMPFAQTEKGFVGVDNGPVRDNINLILANVTARPYATPYHAVEVVRKALAPFSIFIPATNFLDGDAGHEVFEISQFGNKMGFNMSGEVVEKNTSPYFLYFEYSLTMGGAFDIFCEVVDQDELDEILADVEDEMESDVTTGHSPDASDSFDSYKSDNHLKEEVKKPTGGLKKACWTGYTAVGMKKKNGKKVPNCVPVSEEQLDEVSKKKLRLYKAANEKSREKIAGSSGLIKNGKPTPEQEKKFKKLDSRVKMDYKASDKLYGRAKVAATNEEAIDEVITKKTPTSKVISDFVHSKNPKFAGKSKKKRIQMALGAKYSMMQKEENINELSKKTKIAYINAAEKDKAELNKQITKDTFTNSPHHDSERSRLNDLALGHKLVASRTKGIARAKKSMKEETLNELSKKTLGSYASKAHKQGDRATQFAASASASGGANKNMEKISDKRFKGVRTAINKLSGAAKVNATNEERIDEVSKETLGSYIKKASHDVAAKSAAVRGFARDSEAHRKNNDLTNSRKSDERSDKMFKKSWNRRKGIAKAVDKLTKEEASPARKGEIAAGRKGSTPAEQGSIAVMNDDAVKQRKSDFKVAKKLARKAMKAQIAKNK